MDNIPAPMSADDFARIRKKSGMSTRRLSAFLRIRDETTIRRWERGLREVSGPVSIIMELIDEGKL